jgi:uncharacterized protein (DUF433 family)
MVEAPGIEPAAATSQLPDLHTQSQLAECGSNVDPAADGNGPTLSRSQRAAHRERGDWRSRITVEPGMLGGRPWIRDLRITVGDLLKCLASGMSEDEILLDFPDLEREDIRAALAFAAERSERVRRLPVE